MKPILYNTDMVRAIQDDRKTATRRLVKPQPGRTAKFVTDNLLPETVEAGSGGVYCFSDGTVIGAPYQPGDILYVRETWGWNYCYDCGMADGGLDIVDLNDGHIESDPFRCDDEAAERVFFAKEKEYGCYCYKASAEDDEIPEGDGHWHPSIHMPKEAARLFLRVTDVRAERLRDITDEQAIAEGTTGISCDHPNSFVAGGAVCCVDCMNTGWLEPPTVNFAEIWDSTVKPADLARYGWNANPWVWVIEFERISKEEALKNERS